MQKYSKQGGGRKYYTLQASKNTTANVAQKYFKQGEGRNTTPLMGERNKTTIVVQKYSKQGGGQKYYTLKAGTEIRQPTWCKNTLSKAGAEILNP